MIIVPFEEKYISAVAEIEKECFSVPWSEKSLREELENEQAFFLVCLKDDSYTHNHFFMLNVWCLEDLRLLKTKSSQGNSLLWTATLPSLFLAPKMQKQPYSYFLSSPPNKSSFQS